MLYIFKLVLWTDHTTEKSETATEHELQLRQKVHGQIQCKWDWITAPVGTQFNPPNTIQHTFLPTYTVFVHGLSTSKAVVKVMTSAATSQLRGQKQAILFVINMAKSAQNVVGRCSVQVLGKKLTCRNIF